jgi:hypothetical protein
MISQTFDAVHFTLPAIAAAQGFALMTGHGVIPPAYWDVETTFWIKWRLAGARMVESVDVMGESCGGRGEQESNESGQ